MSTPQNPNTAALAQAGVSIWLDDLSRTRLDEGTLEKLIATRSVTGVTTNPSIFAVALADAGARLHDHVGERLDDSGEGCADSTLGYGCSMGAHLRASAPHSKPTSGWLRATSARIAHSVISSQPLPRCEPASDSRTVRTLLSSMTPSSAQQDRSP